MLPVYLSDMRALVERDPNIWQFILDGHFSVQISNILGTAKDRDHAGKQENKKNENSKWFNSYHKTRKE